MNILIVGDLSSAGYFLKSGFEKVGFNVNHVALQHLWMDKKIEINLSSNMKGLMGSLETYLNLRKVFRFKDYDSVIFIEHFPFPRRFGLSNLLSRYLSENNVKSYLWLIGCDSHQFKWSSVNNGDMCSGCINIDRGVTECPQLNDRNDEIEFLKNITKIVPGGFEYFSSRPPDQYDKLTNPIQLCVNFDEIKFSPLRSDKPLKFFHGLNRKGMKGTALVEDAFVELASLYPDVEFIVDGKLGYDKYLNLLEGVGITLDQVFNQSTGANTLINMAMGKLVVVGNLENGCKAYGIPQPNAVSQIKTPNFKGVFEASIEAIEMYYSNPHIAEEARSYVETYHSPVLVANRFIEEVFNGN